MRRAASLIRSRIPITTQPCGRNEVSMGLAMRWVATPITRMTGAPGPKRWAKRLRITRFSRIDRLVQVSKGITRPATSLISGRIIPWRRGGNLCRIMWMVISPRMSWSLFWTKLMTTLGYRSTKCSLVRTATAIRGIKRTRRVMRRQFQTHLGSRMQAPCLSNTPSMPLTSSCCPWACLTRAGWTSRGAGNGGAGLWGITEIYDNFGCDNQ